MLIFGVVHHCMRNLVKIRRAVPKLSQCDAAKTATWQSLIARWKESKSNNPRCQGHDEKIISICYNPTEPKLPRLRFFKKPNVFATTQIFFSLSRFKFEFWLMNLCSEQCVFFSFEPKVSAYVLNALIPRYHICSARNLNG